MSHSTGINLGRLLLFGRGAPCITCIPSLNLGMKIGISHTPAIGSLSWEMTSCRPSAIKQLTEPITFVITMIVPLSAGHCLFWHDDLRWSRYRMIWRSYWSIGSFMVAIFWSFFIPFFSHSHDSHYFSLLFSFILSFSLPPLMRMKEKSRDK